MVQLLSFIFLAITIFEVAALECGTRNFTRPLISKGTKTHRGEWPFLTALYYIEEYKFFCGGTLISHKHVLTAAHCVNQKHIGFKLLPVDVVVLLGAYDLTSRLERGLLQRDIEEIHVHPDWRVYSEKYDADVAILVLTETVKFTNYIRPVCMPTADAYVDDARGSVVGWGLTEMGRKPNKEFIKHAFARTLNDSYCYTTDPYAAVISSTRTFCGRGEDGNPNNGDSGGGFYILYGSVWVQHGIVSALRTNATGYVDANSIVVYTNVKHFKSWIVEIVTLSGGAVGEANINIEINLDCHYGYSVEDVKYGCYVDNLDIRSDNFAVISLNGVHQNHKTDQDVEFIQFRNGTMFFIPYGTEKIFKNLTILEVSEKLSTKHIRRSDFKNFQNLVELKIEKNDIQTLDDECLKDLTNLEKFQLNDNNLKEIDEPTFVTNAKLREVWLKSNKLEVLPRNLFRNNSLLEVVILHQNSLIFIDESTFEKNVKLRKVFLSSNKLEFLHRSLFKNNFLLEIIGLSENSLVTIDETSFEMNTKLKHIWLHSNKLEVLPRSLFKNNLLLENVNLNENAIVTIDETSFETNAKLRQVWLYSNKIEFLHRNLFRNNLMLEIVDLKQNSLSSIDESTFEMNAKLRAVWIYSNEIKVLPHNLFQNNLLLEIVSFGKNSLVTINETSFETNTKLREIWLYSNKLEALPHNLFKNNLLLEKVSLHHISITKIDERTFETNVQLREVQLNSNKLDVLPRDLFKNNFLLEIVALNENSLVTIDESSFETNVNLRKIHLDSNKIEFLPRNLFQNNLLLEYVDLRENSIKIIETDFTGYKSIMKIFFYNNVCINAYYKGDDDPNIYLNQFRNLTEFQNLIRVNCSSATP